ncbi:MAG: ATP-binding protein, partial [Gammaproteobacteria bacterium]|nr:ATP-binding protein [Gammaproteobacteria bacterium]
RLVNDSSNNLSEIVGYWADITDRKKVEQDMILAKDQAIKANQYKSSFLSRMSHELRTPMNAILGFAQLLEMNAVEESERQHIFEISNAGKHLLDLINDVLDLSKIETGNIEISLESIRLGNIISECITLVMNLIGEKNIRLDSKGISDNSSFIKVDYTRFKQVVINILSNAIKYNKQNGSVQIKIDDISEQYLRLSICDSGNGLTEQQQKLLFQPFERLGAENTDIEGTGIGLVISKQLMEMMGGSIGYELNPEGGSTFWVDVKKGVEEISPDAVKTIKSVADMNKEARKILYVEDNPANLHLVSEVIKKTQHQLITAKTGLAGIESAIKNKPDLILLDINLPELNGFEVFEKIRMESSMDHVPVVALSANAMKKEIDKANEMGFTKYLTKPINVRELLSTIDSLV